MSVHVWNSSFSHPRANHSRPNGSCPSPTLLACRICDKIFLSNLALIEHYESHQDELAQKRQEHLRINRPSNLPDRRGNNFTDNPFQPCLPPSLVLQQRRHHPYLPNGYRPLLPRVPERNPVAATRTPPLLPPRNPGPNSSLTVINSLNSPSTPANSVANTKQLVTHQFMQISPPKVSLSQRSDSVFAPQPVQSQKAQEQKGFDQSAEKTTVWYLGQLEQPISKKSPEKRHEYNNLDLRLKL